MDPHRSQTTFAPAQSATTPPTIKVGPKTHAQAMDESIRYLEKTNELAQRLSGLIHQGLIDSLDQNPKLNPMDRDYYRRQIDQLLDQKTLLHSTQLALLEPRSEPADIIRHIIINNTGRFKTRFAIESAARGAEKTVEEIITPTLTSALEAEKDYTQTPPPPLEAAAYPYRHALRILKTAKNPSSYQEQIEIVDQTLAALPESNDPVTLSVRRNLSRSQTFASENKPVDARAELNGAMEVLTVHQSDPAFEQELANALTSAGLNPAAAKPITNEVIAQSLIGQPPNLEKSLATHLPDISPATLQTLSRQLGHSSNALSVHTQADPLASLPTSSVTPDQADQLRQLFSNLGLDAQKDILPTISANPRQALSELLPHLPQLSQAQATLWEQFINQGQAGASFTSPSPLHQFFTQNFRLPVTAEVGVRNSGFRLIEIIKSFFSGSPSGGSSGFSSGFKQILSGVTGSGIPGQSSGLLSSAGSGLQKMLGGLGSFLNSTALPALKSLGGGLASFGSKLLPLLANPGTWAALGATVVLAVIIGIAVPQVRRSSGTTSSLQVAQSQIVSVGRGGGGGPGGPYTGPLVVFQLQGGVCWPTTGCMGGYMPENHPSIDAAGSAIDIGNAVGTPIIAPLAGRVIFAGWNNYGYGNLVIMSVNLPLNTGGSQSCQLFFGHLAQITVPAGTTNVIMGTQLGLMDDTGNSEGSHLHYEVRCNGVKGNIRDLFPAPDRNIGQYQCITNQCVDENGTPYNPSAGP